MLAIPTDDHAQNRHARYTLLGRELVEPFDVFIRQIGEDAVHGILISYHDIMSSGQIPQHFDFQQSYQSIVHKIILIRNIKNYYALGFECRIEALLHFISVMFFHHYNDICPPDLFQINRIFSVVIRARRANLDIGTLRKYLFCCGAAELVLATDKKEVLHFPSFFFRIAS